MKLSNALLASLSITMMLFFASAFQDAATTTAVDVAWYLPIIFLADFFAFTLLLISSVVKKE